MIKHHSIQELKGTLCIKNDMLFWTLQDLVSHYSHHAGPLGNTLNNPCVAECGPLQPYCCHDVEEKERVGGTMVVELVVGGRKCLGGPTEVPLFELQSPECLHSMQLMLAEECNLRQSIQHPNIVEFLGVYFKEECKVAYVVMECLHSTLSAYLEKNGVPDSSTSYNILSDVALGLCHLHEQTLPIVHGELSAESVLLSSTLHAKISNIKATSILSNTPACQSLVIQPRSLLKSCYLPPEAHSRRGPSYDTSFDCFSFGILIIHTLSGRLPLPKNMDYDATQCAEYMKDAGLTCQMKEMVRKCLQDNPITRPHMSTVVKGIHYIMVC